MTLPGIGVAVLAPNSVGFEMNCREDSLGRFQILHTKLIFPESRDLVAHLYHEFHERFKEHTLI